MPTETYVIKADNQTRKAFKAVQADVVSTTTKIAGLVGAGGFGALVAITGRTQVENYNFAKSLKAANQELGAFGYAAETVNISHEKMNDILKDVNERIGDAYGNNAGEAVEVLDKLNLSTERMVQLSADKQLLAIAEQLGNIGTQAEKAQIMEALGSDATLLLPLLENNAALLKELRKDAIAFGVAISDVDAQQLKEADDSFRRIQGVIKGAATSLALELSPAIIEISEYFTDAANDANGFKEDIHSALELINEDSLILISTLASARFIGPMLGGIATKSAAMSLQFISATRESHRLQIALARMQGTSARTATGLLAVGTAAKGLKGVAALLGGPAGIITGAITALSLWSLTSDDATESTGNLIQEVDQLLGKFDQVRAGKMKDALADIQEAMQEHADKIASIQTEALAGSPNSPLGQNDLAQIQQHTAAIGELTLRHAELQSTLKDTEREKERTKVQEHHELTEEFIDLHNERVYEIQAEAERKRLMLVRASRQAELSLTGDIFQNLSSLMASEHKKEFEIGKKAAIAGALIKGYQAVVNSYEKGTEIGGPAVGVIFAATAAIATKMQIDAIRRQQFQGGGGSIPAISGNSNNQETDPTSTPPINPLAGQGQQGGSQIVVNVIVQGNTYGVDDMNELIVNAVRTAVDNDETIIPKSSMNGLILQDA